MQAAEIARRLAADAEQVARYLLPQGKRDGHEWRAGSAGGEPGQSLGVRLTGEKAGVWADFAGDGSGDLLDLWMAARGVDLPEAMREACSYLGVPEPSFTSGKGAECAPVERPQCAEPRDAVADWLEERGLSTAAQDAYKLASKGDELVLPYLRAGELVAIKYRGIHDKARMRVDRGGAMPLFGWQAIPDDARHVVITEGELDAVACWQMGYPALSVPNGAQGLTWIEVEYGALERFDTIYVWMDADEQGQTAASKIVDRLGAHRCRVVQQGVGKDANDWLLKGMDANQLIMRAKTLDPTELKSAGQFTDEVIRAFYPPDDYVEGIRPPWEKAEGKILFRPAELTIVTGINGHGKAVSLDTEIPTPNGWTTMGALSVGDQVFDERGFPCNVVAATEVMHDRPCYLITFSDGETVIADANHEWRTKTQRCLRSERNAAKNERRRAANPDAVRRCDQSSKRTYPSVVTTREIAESVEHMNGEVAVSNHAIPVCGELAMPPALLPVEPYVLGAWLGDGDSTHGCYIYGADEEIFQRIRTGGYVVEKAKPKYKWLIRDLRPKLRREGLLNNKHVPAEYLRASSRQRLALLQGLMDTDGSITDYGRCEFTSMNPSLADAVLDLARSFGIIATAISGRASVNGKDCGEKYRITFTTTVQVFSVSRKLTRIPRKVSTRAEHRWIESCEPIPSVPVRCIQVDSVSHLYLCTRAMIPTHNSLIASQIALDACYQGARACIASMEMQPRLTLQRMVRQAAGLSSVHPIPSIPYIREIQGWLDKSLWLFAVTGTAKADRMLQVFEYAQKRYDIGLFVVDSLAKCGLAEDDYNGQKHLVERLKDFTIETNAHVLLITHPRKSSSEDEQPGKMDVRGAQSITDMADNGCSLWRNKRKEEVTQKDEDKRTDADKKQLEKPDAFLTWWKSRNGEWEGKLGLWWHDSSQQFLEHQRARPRTYVEYSSTEADTKMRQAARHAEGE